MEYKFDLIIPIYKCNIAPEFEYRIRNCQMIISLIPESVKLTFVEHGCPNVPFEDTYQNRLEGFIKYKDKNKNVELIYCNYEGPMCKGFLYNVGVKYSETNNIILGESDCIPLDPFYFKKLEEYMNKTKLKWGFGWNKIYYLDKDKESVTREDTPRKGMAEGGLTYFQKSFYEQIGGANEYLKDLGGIDNELARRAEFASKTYDKFNATIFHYWHPYNYMKRDDWKHAKYRDDNRKIYSNIVKDPAKYIKELSDVYKHTGDGIPLFEKKKER